LAISDRGYTLAATPTLFEPGRQQGFGVRILDRDGQEVRDLEEQHGTRMHLIVVRRDMSHYQHLHPSPSEGGAWSVPLTLPEPGIYRAFVDFAVGGEALTLGVDLTAPGNIEFVRLPDPTATSRAEGDYEVTMEAEVQRGETEGRLGFRVRRGGEDVEDLEPYLGALGHLVALREGDLAYLHVHPTGGKGSRIEFHASFPSLGRYRLFLQFAHQGSVRTAAFTVEANL
jgi:hypothetical protein